jgi:hypothetical protein
LKRRSDLRLRVREQEIELAFLKGRRRTSRWCSVGREKRSSPPRRHDEADGVAIALNSGALGDQVAAVIDQQLTLPVPAVELRDRQPLM